jgi:carbon-monoxide dehydrogenase medium subunit
VQADGSLVIGGMARLADIEAAPAVRRGWPLLAQALRGVANPRVRAVATVGGNLAHADPHMDMPPVMAALRAQVTITSAHGARTVEADDLCTGYYETVLRRDELITELRLPPQAGAGHYLKMTTRAAHDWPALGLAVVVGAQGTQVASASLLLGAATDRPTRLASAEAILLREGCGDAALSRAAEAAANEAAVSADAHGSAAYKRHLLRVALPRAIRSAIQRSAA